MLFLTLIFIFISKILYFISELISYNENKLFIYYLLISSDRRADLEMTLVHYKASYGSLKKATEAKDDPSALMFATSYVKTAKKDESNLFGRPLDEALEKDIIPKLNRVSNPGINIF